MNYGPLEFAAHLRRRDARRQESATVRAARAAAPVAAPARNALTIVSGPKTLKRSPRSLHVDAVDVREVVARYAPSGSPARPVIHVAVPRGTRPQVLVLSSHLPVDWQLVTRADAGVLGVLVAGTRASTVSGAGSARVASIGGFYSFKRGTVQFRHLEDEVLRYTGCAIEGFRSEESAPE